MRFSRRTFRQCKRTRRQSKETKYEDCFCHHTLSIGSAVYGLWPERISQLHPSTTSGESAGDAVLHRHQFVALCRVLLRGAVDRRTATTLRLLRATCADVVGS